jgi:hypothetical protein
MDLTCIYTWIMVSHAGVHRVLASSRMDMVLVYGGARLDSATLRWFLQKLGDERHISHGGGAAMRRVDVLSAGGRPNRSHYEGSVHLAPTSPPPPTNALAPYPNAYPPPPLSPPGAGPRWLRRYLSRQPIIDDPSFISQLVSQVQCPTVSCTSLSSPPRLPTPHGKRRRANPFIPFLRAWRATRRCFVVTR